MKKTARRGAPERGKRGLYPNEMAEIDDEPLVRIDVDHGRFEVEMSRRLNERAAPGWWDMGDRR